MGNEHSKKQTIPESLKPTKRVFLIEKKENRNIYSIELSREALTSEQAEFCLQEIDRSLRGEANFRDIFKLNLQNNKLEYLPLSLNLFESIKFLDVSYNSALPACPPNIEKLKFITDLDISGNDVETIDDFPVLEKITLLRIGNTKISNFRSFRKKFPKLAKLFVYELPIKEIVDFPRLKHLTNLDFDNCRLTSACDVRCVIFAF
jgi:hypothetical protein